MNKKILFLSIGIGIVLIIGIVSIIATNKEDPNEDKFIFEGEFEVVMDKGDYLLKGFVGESPLNLRLVADPREVKDIPSEDDIKTKLFPTSLIFITLKPNLTSKSVIAATEISKITGHSALFRTQTFGALTEESNNKGAPIITCVDATKEKKVIHLKLSDETRISSENNCIILEGQTEEDLIKASDKLVLQLLEIL